MKSFFWKTVALIIAVLATVLCLSSCDLLDGLKNDTADDIVGDIQSGAAQDQFNDLFSGWLVDYYIDWGDGGAAHEYTTSAELDEASHDWLEGTPVTLPYHKFTGVYTEPNGAGEMVFGASGNIVAEKLVQNTIYFACWVPEKITLEFRIDEGDVYDGYTFLNGTTVQHRSFLPNEPLNVAFPEIISDLPLQGWRVGKLQVSDGSLWNPAYQKVSDLPFEEAKNGILTLTPVFQRYNCFLTLEWGNRTEEIEIPYGAYASDYLEHGTTFAGMELIGWARDKNETASFIKQGEQIYEDTTLHAIWKYYRQIELYNVKADETGGFAFPVQGESGLRLRVYQYDPRYLPIPQRAGYTFLGWYDSPDFYGEQVSRLIRYEEGENGARYYAKWKKTQYEIRVQKPFDTSAMYETLTVTLGADENYRADYGPMMQYIGEGKIMGLKFSDSYQFDGDGIWLGNDPISDSRLYSFVFYPDSYTVTVRYTDPITGASNQTATLTAVRGEDDRYALSDISRLPSLSCARIGGLYYKAGSRWIKVFDGDGKCLLDGDTAPIYINMEAIYAVDDVEVRFQLPEGFSVEGEAACEGVFVSMMDYGDSLVGHLPTLVPNTEECGSFIGWYHEFTDENGEITVCEGDALREIRASRMTILYDEEKKVHYTVLKAKVTPTADGSENGGQGTDKETEDRK